MPDDPSGGSHDSRQPPGDRISIVRCWAELSAAAAAGGYAWFQGDLLHWNRWRRGVEDADPALTLMLMGAAGLVLGAVCRQPGWIIGLATAALPIVRIPIDVIEDPTSHNLLPFEVAIYLFTSSPAIVVAVLWDALRGRGPLATLFRDDDPGPG